MAQRRGRRSATAAAVATADSVAQPCAGQRLKTLRLARGLTLAELARLTGKTKGYLSKLERSARLPPFTTLGTLAQALGTDIDALLSAGGASGTAGADGRAAGAAAAIAPATAGGAAATAARNIDLHRGAKGRRRLVRGEAYSYLPLVTQYRGKYMLPFLMQLPPGKTRRFTHDGEEFTFVLDGAVELIYEKRRYKLTAGDGFYLDSRLEHVFVNRGKRAVSMLSVSFNYRRF